MGYVQETVTTNSTELGFLQAFISAVTNNTGITCPTTDLETQFSNSSGTPNFVLNFNDAFTLTFTRYQTLSTANSTYQITDSKGILNSPFVYFNTSSLDYETADTRTWGFKVAHTNSVIVFTLYDYSGSSVFSTASFTIGTENYVTIDDTKDFNAIFTNNFITDSNTELTAFNRLNYVYDTSDATSVEIIWSKVFLTASSTNRALTTALFADTSTVTPNSVLTINGSNYLALDAHTIMAI